MLLLVKAFGIWLLMLTAAVGNGLLRERLLAPWIGAKAALPVSGGLLALLLFCITWCCMPVIGDQRKGRYLGIGLFWTGCTILFEFGLGRFVAGKSWREILQVFDLARGNLFSLVLLVTLFSPSLAARLRRRRWDK